MTNVNIVVFRPQKVLPWVMENLRELLRLHAPCCVSVWLYLVHAWWHFSFVG